MAENIKYLNDDNFNEEITEGVTLVDFYADWCGPCRMIAPVLEAISTNSKAKIRKVDIEAAQGVTANYNVTSIPTLILFKDGQEVDRVVGVRDQAALESMINAAF